MVFKLQKEVRLIFKKLGDCDDMRKISIFSFLCVMWWCDMHKKSLFYSQSDTPESFTMKDFFYKVGRYAWRIPFFVISCLCELPTYIIWMSLLYPVRVMSPETYWWLESYMCKLLEMTVITWFDTGGYKSQYNHLLDFKFCIFYIYL